MLAAGGPPMLALAPMQDVTDLAFWRLMTNYGGADVYFTEYFRVYASSVLEKNILKSITANPTGRPVIALGGFSGRDSILGSEDFARLVTEGRVRFALIGDGSPGLRLVFGEGHQKALVEWIRANGRPVDPALWRTTGDGPSDWMARGAEAIGAQLYDLRPQEHGG